MSKHRVAVLKVAAGQLSVTAAAAECHLSRGHLQRLLARYRAEGLDGLEPRSRRPRTSPHAVPDELRDRIVELRNTGYWRNTRRDPGRWPGPRATG